MLDHRAFLQDADSVVLGLTRRGIDRSIIDTLTSLADKRRHAIAQAEALRHRLNVASDAVKSQAQSGDHAGVEQARLELKSLKQAIKEAEEAQNAAENELESHLLTVPNLPDASIPDGPDESHNRIERVVGTPKNFGFAPKAHWDLVEALGLVDFERAAKISGARFAVYRGAGARLERALIAFMLDVARENGFDEVAPPILVRREAMLTAGQYPKFEGESFETLESEYVLLPTSEVALVNLHRDEVFDESQLPIRYTAYTPCFRREAGAAGKDTRGLIRQHQFNKVELVSFCRPQDSDAELEKLTQSAEDVLQRLELPYRVVTLCSGDMGFCAAKTYDIEVWLPGQNAYREISSCSNCTDYQARRGKIRYRPDGDGQKKNKPMLVHTLNGSGLAAGRTFLAVVENYQRADGRIDVPKALVPYLGCDVIGV